MRVLIGMETSGALRRRFQAAGHFAVSIDFLPAEDADAEFCSDHGGHIVGDLFERVGALGIGFDLGIFHPDCTYLTNSAAWAFGDGPYHQRVKPGTLVGSARREAREHALDTVRRIMALPIRKKAIENPVGAITRIRPASQIIQPFQFGDDASKATVLILESLPKLPIDHALRKAGRKVEWPRGSGKIVERWANQTDGGQNALTPHADRWKDRARTWPGIADAMVRWWGDPNPEAAILRMHRERCRAAEEHLPLFAGVRR